MIPIPAAVARILTQPAPVLIIDTCNFLDLFRCAPPSRPRVLADEIQIASKLLKAVTDRPGAVHLVVPELMPGKFADNADQIECEFEKWLGIHDQNQTWLAAVAPQVGIAPPIPSNVQSLGLHAALRRLASDLLAQAVVLDRDQPALDRAVARLTARPKRRPSHNNQIKDSMNLEQSLELCSQLRNAGFTHRAAFISSNTKDYAATSPTSHVHADLQPDFDAVKLEYFPSLRAAAGALRLP
jgi:hypothetical protein